MDWWASTYYREAWGGYYVFADSEHTCADGQAYTCVDSSICNSVPPYSNDNDDGSAWLTAGSWCFYEDEASIYYESVNCTYTFENATDFVFLPGDTICSIGADLVTMVVYECKARSEGGANCTTYSPLVTSVSADDMASAWNVTEFTDSVYMEFHDVSEDWWYEDDASLYEVECYDWKEAVDPYSEFPYNFREYDYACDAGIVWECIDVTQCNLIQPMNDTAETVWFALPFFESPEQPEWVEDVDCVLWEEGYPFMWFEPVCDFYGSLFYCSDVTNCPWVEPNYYDWFVWEVDEESYATIVDGDSTIETVNCEDYWSLVDYSGLNDTFTQGDIVCEGDRAFVCAQEGICNSMSPTYAMFEGLPGWELMKAYANVQYGDDSWDEEFDLTVDAKNACTKSDMLKTELTKSDGSSVWPAESDVSTEIQYINGQICGQDEVHINAINAAFIGEGIDIEMIEFEIDAAMNSVMDEFMSESNAVIGMIEEMTMMIESMSDPQMLEFMVADCALDASSCFPYVEELGFPNTWSEDPTEFFIEFTLYIEALAAMDVDIEIDEAAMDAAFEEIIDLDNFALPANVLIIEHLFSEEDLLWIAPNTEFSYDDFMIVMSKGTAFCGDLPTGSTESIEDVCMRELSFFFVWALHAEKTPEVCDDLQDEECYATMPFLQHLFSTGFDQDCFDTTAATCSYDDATDRYEPVADQQYYARGYGPEPLVGV